MVAFCSTDGAGGLGGSTDAGKLGRRGLDLL